MTVPPSTARSWTRPLALTMLALLIVPSMLGFKGGCKCKPDDTGDTEDSDAAWQKIKLERKLQVSRIMPDLVEPNTGLTADIIGAGLQERATVAVVAHGGLLAVLFDGPHHGGHTTDFVDDPDNVLGPRFANCEVRTVRVTTHPGPRYVVSRV